MTYEYTRNPLLIGERVSFYVVAPAEADATTPRVDADDADPALHLIVRVPVGSPRTTDGYPNIADRVLARYPEIHRHRCANGRALGVRNEFARTEVAHLFEHIAIEELALAGALRATLRGETAWDFRTDGPGVYRVTLHGVGPGETTVATLLSAAHSTLDLMCG